MYKYTSKSNIQTSSCSYIHQHTEIINIANSPKSLGNRIWKYAYNIKANKNNSDKVPGQENTGSYCSRSLIIE